MSSSVSRRIGASARRGRHTALVLVLSQPPRVHSVLVLSQRAVLLACGPGQLRAFSIQGMRLTGALCCRRLTGALSCQRLTAALRCQATPASPRRRRRRTQPARVPPCCRPSFERFVSARGSELEGLRPSFLAQQRPPRGRTGRRVFPQRQLPALHTRQLPAPHTVAADEAAGPRLPVLAQRTAGVRQRQDGPRARHWRSHELHGRHGTAAGTDADSVPLG